MYFNKIKKNYINSIFEYERSITIKVMDLFNRLSYEKKRKYDSFLTFICDIINKEKRKKYKLKNMQIDKKYKEIKK